MGAENRSQGEEKRKNGCGEEKKWVRRSEKMGAEKRNCTLGPLYLEPFKMHQLFQYFCVVIGEGAAMGP